MEQSMGMDDRDLTSIYVVIPDATVILGTLVITVGVRFERKGLIIRV